METRDLPPLNWLRSFDAAARHLSFTAAAEELLITQSAVSQQIKSLEHYLGHALFVRRPRRLQLTDVARDYLPTVMQAFQILRDGTEEFIAPKEGMRLQIKSNTAFSVFWLMPNLTKFTDRYPDIQVQISTALAISDYAGSTAAVEIRYGRGEWDDVGGTKLRQEVLYPVCAREVAGQLSELRDLADVPRLYMVHHSDDWAYWERAMGLHGQLGTDGHFFETYILSLDMARQGRGVALGHDTLCEGLLANGDLVKPFDAVVKARDSYFAVLPEGERSSPEAVLFFDWLVEAFVPSAGSQVDL